MPDGKRRRAVVDVALPALLITLQLALFGPYTIYSGNAAEFSASFWGLVRPLLLPAAIVFLAIVAPALLLRDRVLRGYTALVFAIGIALWVQGNLLVADYGPLNGAAIDWNLQAWRNKYEVTMWAAVPLLALAAAAPVAGIAAFGSGVLLALQSVLFVSSMVQAGPGARAEWRGPSDAMFELSRTQNTIHIVLDTFHSDVFSEILEAERPSLDRDFSGFVFFRDHVGAFPTTMVSIPAMLTGTAYRNEQPLPDYIRDHFDKGSLFSTLRSHGVRVDNITEMRFDSKSATNFFRMPRPYVSYDAYTRFAAWQLADLSVFRHAPHILRPSIYNDQNWRLQAVFGEDQRSKASGRGYHPVNGAAVLDQFAQRLTPAVDGPMYKFMHVGIPHLPVAVNANCVFVGVQRFDRTSYRGQARCGVARVAAVLNRLRALGLYDSSLIVLSSDHGLGLPPREFVHDRPMPDGNMSVIAGKAMALLLVKAPHATGAVRVSAAPTAITDIPATILDILKVPHTLAGTPALKVDEHARRVRTYASYEWEHEDWRQAYFEHLDLLDIDGSLRSGDSWRMRTSLYPPGADDLPRVRGVFELQRSSRGIMYRWGGPNVFLHVPPGARGFEMTIRSIAPQPQKVTVKAGGRELQTLTLSDQNWVTLRHRLDPPADDAALWVEMAVDPPWRPRGSARRLGVMTRDIRWMP